MLYIIFSIPVSKTQPSLLELVPPLLSTQFPQPSLGVPDGTLPGWPHAPYAVQPHPGQEMGQQGSVSVSSGGGGHPELEKSEVSALRTQITACLRPEGKMPSKAKYKVAFE